MNTIVTSKEEILKNSRELIREKGWAAVSIRSVASACGVSVGSIYNYYDSRLSLSAPRSRASGAKFSTARRTRLYFRTCRPVSNGCTSAWPTAMSSIPAFSHCIRSALCGTKRLTASATCSRPGTTCSWGCAQFSSRMPGYGRMPLMNSSRQKNLPRCCFHSCCPLCCGRIMTPVLCWRSCAEPYIDHRLFIPTSVWEF